MLPNKIVWLPPTEVGLTFIDRAIPLNSHWIWVYVSYYPFIFLPFLLTRDIKVRKILFFSFVAATGLAFFIFFLYPTTIARELYPLEVRNWSDSILYLIRTTDESSNCIPSMHVASSLIAALTFCYEGKKRGVLAMFWFLMISYSTMATKQHYFYDVVTGTLFGGLCWSFCFLRLKKSAEI
ncbi:MAG: phosphatase PAP2 family protein [Pseudobdellovibrio sp.]